MWTLTGSWQGQKEENEKAYTVTFKPKEGKPASVRGLLGKFDDILIIDTFPGAPEKMGIDNDLVILHAIPNHVFCKIRFDDENKTVYFSRLNLEWIEMLIDKKKFDLDYTRIHRGELDETIFLTASTKELQAFFQKHASNSEAFGEETKLQRKE